MSTASDTDWRCWFLLSRGVSVREIADRVGVPEASIPASILRVSDEIEEKKKTWDDGVHVPRLYPSFGPSCKPYATMTCADIHPCKACKGVGCDDCNGTGAGPLDDDRSPFYCSVCSGSGWDGAAQMIPYPLPAMEPAYEQPDDGLQGGTS